MRLIVFFTYHWYIAHVFMVGGEIVMFIVQVVMFKAYL